MLYKYACVLLCAGASAQTATEPVKPPGLPVNYDEARVGSYTLPDPLVMSNGKRVQDARTWTKLRRPEILKLFQTNMHGRSPGRPHDITFNVFDKGTPVFDGKAVRRQIEITFPREQNAPKMDLLLYLPVSARKRAPVLMHLGFSANSATIEDPGIRPGLVWNREHKKVPANTVRQFPPLKIQEFLAKGFGVATMYYGDIEPDFQGGMPLGVRGLYLKPGQAEPAADEWGAIGAWAWGLSRAMDYLETDPGVDAKRVAIVGISRLGKTVLWAGASDPRFAMVIASCSGEGGASLSRRDYGETIKHINRNFPYWFDQNYQKFGDHVDQLPVDAHMLLSLIAPRPLYLSTGDQDKWGDPKGEFLAAVAAEPVYRLLGAQGLGTSDMPAADQPIMHTIGYHMHSGGHGTNPFDWQQYLKFMEMHLQPTQ
jgi:hypothetical protein